MLILGYALGDNRNVKKTPSGNLSITSTIGYLLYILFLSTQQRDMVRIVGQKTRKYVLIGGGICVFVYILLNLHWTNLYQRQKYTWTSKEEFQSSALGLSINSSWIRGKNCQVPDVVVKGMPWPNCYEKIMWMKDSWQNDDCYAMQGVNGSLCSILEYLSLKESECPPNIAIIESQTKRVPLKTPRKNLSAIIELLDGNEDMTWMKNRIQSMGKLWVKSASNAFTKSLRKISLHKKKIHLHIGLMDLGIGKEAMRGGPLGELVQWSDLISTLHILGHDIVITSTKRELTYIYTEYMFKNSGTGCAILSELYAFPFDIVYTDVRGYKVIRKMLPKLSAIKCRFRILDSFGTETQFNIEPTGKTNPFGGLRLNLKQFNTMYPHTPDNTFLGFVVENPFIEKADFKEDRNIALVYGKDGGFWSGVKPYLDIVRKYVPEIHGTVSGNMDDVPDYVINHGILPSNELYKLLQRTRIFIGLGFPFEGPGPLEAVAMGAIYLNPTLNKAMEKKIEEFFKIKPTNRVLTSQNPYAEKYIEEPQVYTLDITNQKEVHEVLNKITHSAHSKPYLPFEFSAEGMLERVAIHIEKPNFCDPVQKEENIWPPISSLRIAVTFETSCNEACAEMGLICEPTYFPVINTRKAFENVGLECDYEHYARLPFTTYPAYHVSEKVCCFQTSNLHFSCSDKISDDFVRLCPCRDFIKGQVSSCRECIR